MLLDIKSIPIPSGPMEDRVLWGFSQDGRFTLKSVTWVMRKSLMHQRNKILGWIWKLNLMPKINFFLWLVLREALPTSDCLVVRRLEITKKKKNCYLCNQNRENINHICKDCPFAQGIWDRIKYNCPTPLFYKGNFLD